MNNDMPPKMRRFLAKRPRRVVEPARAHPRGWMTDCLKRQGGRCYYCRRKMKRNPSPVELILKPTIDHVIPLSNGGENKRRNVVASCVECNQTKGAQSEAEFRLAIATAVRMERDAKRLDRRQGRGPKASPKRRPVNDRFR